MKYYNLIAFLMLIIFSAISCSAQTNNTSSEEATSSPQEEKESTDTTNKNISETGGDEKIRELQKMLRKNGYYSGPINGIMTPETRDAMRGMDSDR